MVMRGGRRPEECPPNVCQTANGSENSVARTLMSVERTRPPFRRAAVAVSAVLLAVGAGALQPLSALAAPASAPASAADAPGASTLVKTAQNVTHPGQLPVGHGDTVNWTVGYHSAAAGDPASATITDVVQGAGSGQSYV